MPLSFLSNTLEQFAIHTACQLGLAATLPREWLVLVPISACLWTAGRALFYYGYSKMTVMRAYGFSYAMTLAMFSIGYVNLHNFTGINLLPETIPKLY